MSWAYRLTDGQLNAQFLESQPRADKEQPKKWKPFQPSGTPPKYCRDRVVDVRHIKLEITLNVPGKSFKGRASLTVRPIADEVRTLELDAVALRISAVACNGKPVREFTATGQKLSMAFDKPLAPDRNVTLTIDYSATPQRGLYFVGPARHYPKKRLSVWSQGQDEDSRYWFPCFDYPNEKATSELLATVPGKWFCLSNGRLLERRANRDGTATFHWRQDVPHSAYLITLCAGEYTEVANEWDGIPVNFYVPPDRVADGRRSFGQTAKMVAFYSRLIGVRYPFAKYAQITATDFIFGGMENTSATTQTDRTLHDARAHLDFSSEPLVSHELVHSWFGNLLTCRDWSHAWLNESFATFFDNLWYRESRGEDEFRYEMYSDLRAYLDEDRGSYRRPIVTNVYRAPIDLFDRHLYQKGACVLNLLRNILGDRLFFKAVTLYVERFSGRCVTTPDLLGALENATGRNFDWLFEQWIYKGGHPEFAVSATWDDKAGSLALAIKQQQKPDELTSIFRLPVKVRLVGKGYDETREFELTEAEHTFHCALPARPKWLAFDPANTIPKTLDLQLDENMLTAQLGNDNDVMGRTYAAQALATKGSLQAVEALGGALLDDKFWGVQAECAAALAKVHTPGAFKALRAATKVAHPKARRAVARALGEWSNDGAAAALMGLARQDKSYFVEAEAAEALGKTRSKRAWPEIVRSLRKSSWQELIRGGALRALVAADPARAVKTLEGWCTLGRPEPARFTALALLGRAVREAGKGDGADKLRVRRLYEKVLDEGVFHDRLAAIHGLRELRDPAAIPALTRFKESALDQRMARSAERAIEAIREGAGVPPEVKALREELDKLKEEAAKSKERLEKLESRAKGKRAAKKKRP
ncbi:MAG: M1 family aminopeptidase [Planctomycetota bacterium]|nr:M1 family aminopeptidase [Planctomycetota bacterium]